MMRFIFYVWFVWNHRTDFSNQLIPIDEKKTRMLHVLSACSYLPKALFKKNTLGVFCQFLWIYVNANHFENTVVKMCKFSKSKGKRFQLLAILLSCKHSLTLQWLIVVVTKLLIANSSPAVILSFLMLGSIVSSKSNI